MSTCSYCEPVAFENKYPIYRADSCAAQSFRNAFAAARAAGKRIFTWQGRDYNTRLASE